MGPLYERNLHYGLVTRLAFTQNAVFLQEVNQGSCSPWVTLTIVTPASARSGCFPQTRHFDLILLSVEFGADSNGNQRKPSSLGVPLLGPLTTL